MLKESSIELHGNDRFEGFGVDMIEKMSQMLDFEYELTLSKDGIYGHFDKETKEWKGMIGSIINWVSFFIDWLYLILPTVSFIRFFK